MSKFFEPLENRQMLSLVIDLRQPGGGKNVTVNNIGDIVNLEIWATATGENASGSDEALQIAVGSLLSTNVSGGAADGTLQATRTVPFNASGSTNGAQVDLDGDGDLDVGSNNNSAATGFFFARNDTLDSGGPVNGASQSWKIGTATFTVTSLKGTVGSTNLNFRTREWISGALWREDGNPLLKNGTSGVYSVGAPVVVKSTGVTPDSGVISGKVWNDADGDGVLDAGETGRSGVSVFLDADTDGVFDAGEASKTSDGSGNYTFTQLAVGTHRVRIVTPGGFSITQPAAGFFDVALNNNTSTGKNFGLKPVSANNASISGTVFSDADKDGVLDAGETKLSNRKIYLDANGNNTLDAGEKSVFSNASGVYTFTGLAAGNYTIRRADLPAGYFITTGVGGDHNVALAAGQAVTNVHIGAGLGTPGGNNGSISGTVFSDTDKDGVLDAGETKLSNRKIYLDANGNNTLDAGEKSVFSNASGVYTFTGLAAGNYTIRRADLPAGYFITTGVGGDHNVALAAGQAVSNINVGAGLGTPGGGTGSISGTVFSDTDEDGVLDASEPKLSARKIYIDANNNNKLDAGEKSVLSNASGVYTFTGLAAGSYVIRRDGVPGGYYITTGVGGDHNVTLAAGQNVTGINVGAGVV